MTKSTKSPTLTLTFSVTLVVLFSSSSSSNFTITNNCLFPIWPGTLAGSGSSPLPMTGFRLDAGQSVSMMSSPGWSGRLWARTNCTFDESGNGTCATGDCRGRLECNGNGATPPASLFEITLGRGVDMDFYDVSLVDGYNLPLTVVPSRDDGEPCNLTSCAADINMCCPKELQVTGSDGAVVACQSACEAFELDQYCCSGLFANPTSCQPSNYSTLFKGLCPQAYSYAFDDGTSTFTCKANAYTITFCPQDAAADGVTCSNTSITTAPASAPAPAQEIIPLQGNYASIKMASSSSRSILPLNASSLILFLLLNGISFFYYM